MSRPFTPTLKWHIKVWTMLLLICVAAYVAVVFITRRLPPPYQHQNPPAQVTPWLS